MSTLNGHTQCVSSVVWKDPQSLYSASWDHTIRRWDISTGENTWDMVPRFSFAYFSYINPFYHQSERFKLLFSYRRVERH